MYYMYDNNIKELFIRTVWRLLVLAHCDRRLVVLSMVECVYYRPVHEMVGLLAGLLMRLLVGLLVVD